jgi:hypothetical protein
VQGLIYSAPANVCKFSNGAGQSIGSSGCITRYDEVLLIMQNIIIAPTGTVRQSHDLLHEVAQHGETLYVRSSGFCTSQETSTTVPVVTHTGVAHNNGAQL